MNPSAFGSLPPSACTLGTAGSYGNDRITYSTYDAANEVTQVTSAYGTSDQRNDLTKTYTSDGLVHTIQDANGNTSTYAYDGMDRLASLTYPDGSYQGYAYDPNGNVTQLRQRDGNTITYAFDVLNRRTGKTPPESGQAVTYTYDNLNRLKSAYTSIQTMSYTYDALGRQLTEAEQVGTMTSAWDIGGRRTRLTWPDGFYVTYDYDELGEMLDVKQSGSTTLASFSYDNLGRRTGVSRENGVSTSYGYDNISDLTSLGYSGSSNNQSFTYAYNPAGQITSRTTTNAAYAWSGSGLSQAYAANNLNQYTSVGGTAYGYDSNGNLGSGTSQTYTYDTQNRLLTASGSPTATLSYDPVDRLFKTVGASTTRFLYDGDQIVEEYDAGTVLRRYVDGPGVDEPIVWFEGSGTSSPTWLLSDERGSIIAGTNSSASVSFINTYDDYGQPGSTANTGRFQYTGQAYIPEAGAYDYKARAYLPSIGRFLQTDPTGYGAGLNLYGYTDDDPVNASDPSGLCNSTDCWDCDASCFAAATGNGDVFASGAPSSIMTEGVGGAGGGGGSAGGGSGPDGGQYAGPTVGTVVITGHLYNWYLDPSMILWRIYAGIDNEIASTGYGSLSYSGMSPADAQSFYAQQAAFMNYDHQLYRQDSYLWAPVLAPVFVVAAAEAAPIAADALGPSGTVFGRSYLGGRSVFGINSNRVLRFGWGWRAEDQINVFRISGKWLDAIMGVKGAHIDLWPW